MAITFRPKTLDGVVRARLPYHRNLHHTGNEVGWWEKARIEPLPIARKLWETSHPRAASRSAAPETVATEPKTVAGSETNPIAVVRS
jgi:hypothetical protein